MKEIFAATGITASLILAGCSFFGPTESVRHDSGSTVYRAAGEVPTEFPETPPSREKVPGEKR